VRNGKGAGSRLHVEGGQGLLFVDKILHEEGPKRRL